ncbi:MAG: heme exporter protein CcmD [Aquabacterium sp.]|nr:heme exporter protein CcmD [Aquabacterium sp.]
MQWQSLSDFIAMDGRGLYIWGAYGVTLACMLIEPVLAIRRRRQAWLNASPSLEDN